MKRYEDKLNRMTRHLENHPHDYQTSISYLKLRSESIIYNRKQKHIEMIKKINKYKER